MKWFSALLFVLLTPLYSYCQEYSYSHYDSKDGLGSSTVYCMAQDRDGFMWFATETGLTRFDGTHFTNFTQEDGLPDNEIIQLFADSKGRVWFAPFRKTVCYYYKGKIYNRENDALLRKVHLNDNVFQFAEDNQGNILLKETYSLQLIQADGTVNTIFTINGRKLGYISLIAGRKEGGFWVIEDDRIYIYDKGGFMLWKTIEYEMKHRNYTAFGNGNFIWRNSMYSLKALSIADKKNLRFEYLPKDEHINLTVIDNRYAAQCTQAGALVYDLEGKGSVKHYLEGIPVCNMFRDSEGNWWFATLGRGVYRLNSAVVLNVRPVIRKVPESVPVRLRNREWLLSQDIMSTIRKYAGVDNIGELQDFTWFNSEPLIHMTTVADTNIILGTKYCLFKAGPGFARFTDVIDAFTVKALCRHNDKILVASDGNVVIVEPGTFKIIDTVWNDRATSLFSYKDTIYIGTLNGLYQITPDRQVYFMGEKIKALQNRIVAVREDANHVVWVATTGAGIIGWRNDKMVASITRRNGLTSNICRSLFYENGKLWVGTDKGLNKVMVLHPGYPVAKYTYSDGLASDIINSVYVLNNKVFVSTPEWLTFFDENSIGSDSRCDLLFTNITIGGTSYSYDSMPATIPHERNNVRFDYVGISYKSGGEIRYRYRLLGLDSNWQETRETFLNYPALPSGDYQLELQAINKFDKRSQLLTAQFTIDKLLYERTWFRLLIGLLFLSTTGLLVWLYVQRIRKRAAEKATIIKRINELEQLSRKAQMNPHFIFNSLNSIQQFVMDADVVGANKFISGFSRLIRQTLDFSSKPEISMEEELDYLTNYLELEKNRLEGAFSWSVSVERGVNPANYYIPPMILQPFVENSVRHGLRFRRDKNGVVTITLKREDDHLVCILEDNGIGRKAARQYKSISPINYQSKGMSLTADRIEMYNKEHAHKITMQIDDLEDDKQQALGTRVTIRFPIV